MAEDCAQIFEALGRDEAAALLRWWPARVEPTYAELEEERDALAQALTDTENRLSQLEANLCKRCAAKQASL